MNACFLFKASNQDGMPSILSVIFTESILYHPLLCFHHSIPIIYAHNLPTLLCPPFYAHNIPLVFLQQYNCFSNNKDA